MNAAFNVLREMSDEELADHGNSTFLRLEALREMAESFVFSGLPRAEYEERLILMAHYAEIEAERQRRREGNSLATATAFHEELPDLMAVIKTGRIAKMAEYLHDRSDEELGLLAKDGALAVKLAGNILRQRRQGGPREADDEKG